MAPPDLAFVSTHQAAVCRLLVAFVGADENRVRPLLEQVFVRGLALREHVPHDEVPSVWLGRAALVLSLSQHRSPAGLEDVDPTARACFLLARVVDLPLDRIARIFHLSPSRARRATERASHHLSARQELSALAGGPVPIAEAELVTQLRAARCEIDVTAAVARELGSSVPSFELASSSLLRPPFADRASVRDLTSLTAPPRSREPAPRDEDSGVVHLAAAAWPAPAPAPSPDPVSVSAPVPAPASVHSTPTPRPTRRWLVPSLLAALVVTGGVAVLRPPRIEIVTVQTPAAPPAPAPAPPSAPSPWLEPAPSKLPSPVATPPVPPHPPIPVPAAPPAASRAAAPIAATPAASESLGAAMQGAVGEPSAAPPPAPAAPADPSTLPKRPPQGAVTAALGKVSGAAKQCIGPDDPISHATLTFDSAGLVERVQVTGRAAGTPAQACIETALAHAKIPAFTDPDFRATMTIRP